MIQRVDEPDKPGPYCAQIGRLQRERCQKVFDLLDRVGRWVVSDEFSSEPPPESLDRTVGALQDRPPDGLEGHCPSRFGEGRIEAAQGRLAAWASEPHDAPREV